MARCWTRRTSSPRARKAIAQARALGVHIVLTSGRPVPGLAPYLHELGITGNDDYCIACNGGLVQRIGTRETVVGIRSASTTSCSASRSPATWAYFQALDSQRMYANQDISYYTVADSHLSRMPLSYRRVEDMDPSMSFIKLMMIDEPEVLDAAIARLPGALTELRGIEKRTVLPGSVRPPRGQGRACKDCRAPGHRPRQRDGHRRPGERPDHAAVCRHQRGDGQCHRRGEGGGAV